MSSPENKKCSPGKVFGTKPPSNLATFDQESPRCLDARLSQHYISPKMICCNFSNFCRKKFPRLKKIFPALIE
jgi:hypothetical protein